MIAIHRTGGSSGVQVPAKQRVCHYSETVSLPMRSIVQRTNAENSRIDPKRAFQFSVKCSFRKESYPAEQLGASVVALRLRVAGDELVLSHFLSLAFCFTLKKKQDIPSVVWSRELHFRKMDSVTKKPDFTNCVSLRDS